MNIASHLIASTTVGAAVALTSGEIAPLPVAVAAGVAPDIDHVLDYFNWYVRRDTRHHFLIFHAWEYLALAAVLYLLVWREPWALGLVLGYTTQLAGDQLFNRVRPGTYFVLVRAAHGFDRRRVGYTDPSRSYGSVVKLLPFGRSKAAAWFRSHSDAVGIGSGSNIPDSPDSRSAADSDE